MNVRPVLLLVECTRLVKTPQDFTNAYAPGVSRVLIPARKNAKISMNVRRKFVTKMLFVITRPGVLNVTARRDITAMVTRAALKLMNAKSLLIRYCVCFVYFATVG